jgi:lysophospholipase L1-like esterase
MQKQTPTSPSFHRRIGLIVIGLGIFIFCTGLIINPWAGRLYRPNMLKYQDVMLNYAVWAWSLGFLIAGLGALMRRMKSALVENLVVLTLTCSLIILSDRYLLAKIGLPLWVADMEKHYAHRPNTVRTWGPKYDNRLIRINRYGHHDDNFPMAKPPGEFRGVIIGDSITMGHGMRYEDTFPNQLEAILSEQTGGRTTFQMINTGVQGYSTIQEYYTLLESLRFEPDFIALGFCMNDLTEPFVVDKRFGGIGTDYHGIAQASSHAISYILNETGYGRWLQQRQKRGKSLELERRWEVFSVRKIAQSPADDPQFAVNWKTTFDYLDKIYDTAAEKKIKIVLLIFPHTFQLMDTTVQEPQRQLIRHAAARGIPVIDFTTVFETLIFDARIVAELADYGFSYDDIHGLYDSKIRKYFLDQDHYTVEGHRVVATHLQSYVSDHFSFERK